MINKDYKLGYHDGYADAISGFEFSDKQDIEILNKRLKKIEKFEIELAKHKLETLEALEKCGL